MSAAHPLFDLAQRTGFDIESLIFCFGIGGVGAVLYNALTGRRLVAVPPAERAHARPRWHRWAMAVPLLLFAPLYVLPWNPIYPGIVAMAAGAAAAALSRPDLKTKTLVGGGIFLLYYAVFLIGIEVTAPGYIERVWNLEALSGLRIAGLPFEELLFAVAFGAYWSGVRAPDLAEGRADSTLSVTAPPVSAAAR